MVADTEKAENAILEGDPISSAFQKILENPEIISTVASAIGMPAPQKVSEGERVNADASSGNALPATLAPLISSLSKRTPNSKISSDQASLLLALKPYVNPNRCEAIDYIIKITEISQLLKKMN